jgi:hypothetical protein
MDIILFQTDNFPGSIQRFFTNSSYGPNIYFLYLDHIAIVLKVAEQVYLFESTSSDVGKTPLSFC